MSTPQRIVFGQTLELVDGYFKLVGYVGNLFRLRNEFTDEVVLLTFLELHRLLVPGEEVETEEVPVAPTTVMEDLDHLNDDDRALIPHLQELLDGTPAIGDTPRPEYATHLPMKGRLESKVLELDKLRMPVPMRTLQRRFERFQRGGPAALGDKRKSGRKEKAFSRADEDVVAALRRVLNNHSGRTQTSYAVLRAELKLELQEAFPHPNDRPALPSVSTIERYVKQLSGDQNPTTSGQLRRTAALVPKHTFQKRTVSAPGDECQMDTTWFDAFVRMPDGQVIRPHLTTLMDKRTRSLIGFHFTNGAPTSDDHAWLIARTLVPHALRPWSAQYAELELPEMPWARYVDGEDHSYDTFRPYIFPRRILIDNGQDFKGILVNATCNRYGIHLTETPPRTPTGKPYVERHFSTIKTMFTRHLPGYVGGSKAERGNEPEKEDVLELRVVIEAFDRWVALVWQNREHEGLIDPLDPQTIHSPNTMYAACIALTGHFMMPLGEEDYIALMPREKRTIQADGISFRNRTYDSPHLAPMRLQKDADGNGIEHFVHYDRSDPSQVWVRSTEDGQWVTCGWTDDAGLLRPNERLLLAEGRHLAASTKRFTNEAAHELAVQFRVEAAAEQLKKQEMSKTKAKAKGPDRPRPKQGLIDVEPTLDRSKAIAAFMDIDELPFA